MKRRDLLTEIGSMGAGALALGALDGSTAPSAMGQANSQTVAGTYVTGQEGTTKDMETSQLLSPFEGYSKFDEPRLEWLFDIDLNFTRVQNINKMPSGAGRGAVYLDSGTITGPYMNGLAVPNSGGDYALFRPDDVLSFDARYMLETDDGTLVMLHNKGYLWGRYTDTMTKIRAWIFEGGPVVDESEYYLRANPTFECETGKYDWLMRHVIVGIGKRKEAGNTVRYYAVL
jgi:hypothetical protein